LMCLNGTRNSQKEERMGKTDDVAVWKWWKLMEMWKGRECLL
jgi:hypothetical protein